MPKWAKKGVKKRLPNGGRIIIAGKNPDDTCIIVTDPDRKHMHESIVLKPSELETHHKDNKTGQRQSASRLDASLLSQIADDCVANPRGMIRAISPNDWSGECSVIDVNSASMPTCVSGTFDIDLEAARPNMVSQEDVANMRFEFGLVVDSQGKCKGALAPHRRQNKLVFFTQEWLERVINASVGSNWLANLGQGYDQFVQESDSQ